MRIELVPTVEEILHEQIFNRTVVVIDVLRASSTIVTALGHGFSHVIPVETIGQANALRNADSLLAGERHCKKIPEFDFNNSPTTIMKGDYTNKHLILTTTNGTRAIQKAERANHLMIGSFLNATACIKHALTQKLDITLYCAGTRQEFALEDGLAAGYMVHKAKQLNPHIHTCDLAEALEKSYLYLADRMPDQLMLTTTGRRLVQHNFVEDILHCGKIDLYNLVPVIKEKRILPHLVS
ncbi:2-phosphosulfolactate phosphatase [Brevibacillus dissolubilis]|uniref:2-phosphosulfolactate phosphatase n=1 Tax=Brevibacillus dissolubilis TaxID=1844116 RepID=UPI001116880C|nr:2-phosphosulfolactate phosphatase [Brevibacillus dissolubilis]